MSERLENEMLAMI